MKLMKDESNLKDRLQVKDFLITKERKLREEKVEVYYLWNKFLNFVKHSKISQKISFHLSLKTAGSQNLIYTMMRVDNKKIFNKLYLF